MTPPDRNERDDNTPIHGIPGLTKRDLMNAAKDGFKELIREQVTEIGYFTIRTVVVALIGGGLLLALYFKTIGKGH